jgi:hypothetical protein
MIATAVANRASVSRQAVPQAGLRGRREGMGADAHDARACTGGGAWLGGVEEEVHAVAWPAHTAVAVSEAAGSAGAVLQVCQEGVELADVRESAQGGAPALGTARRSARGWSGGGGSMREGVGLAHPLAPPSGSASGGTACGVERTRSC